MLQRHSTARFELINISNNAHFLACISAYLSKIISKLFNTLGVNSSYVITLRSVFVQANGELDTLSPLYIMNSWYNHTRMVRIIVPYAYHMRKFGEINFDDT